MYERILLPFDGSMQMLNAIDHCIHQANTNDAAVHGLYVVDVRAYVMLPDEQQQRVRQLLVDEGNSAVAELQDRAEDEEIEFVGDIVEGVPHEAILTYAADNEIDLIVMGTHGRTGEDKRIVGSVAEEVVRNAEIPVLTVRTTDRESEELEEDGDQDVPEEQLRYIT